MYKIFSLLLIISFFSCTSETNKNYNNLIYAYHQDIETRWSSAENLNGIKGSGGKENNGAKGHPTDNINAGTTRTLLDIQGQGIINRIWFTINDRSLTMLRSLKIEMYWDNETKPAVSVPVADFFGLGQGIVKFENEFFASPEGRSFNCFIPMPFKKGAKITISNESDKKLNNIFFDVDFSLLKEWNDDFLYFHAYWNRDTATIPGKDYELLPHIGGRGRLLGTHVAVNANPLYRKSWWGEGEVKMYIDDDGEFPTLTGTGTEDYIGTAWGQGAFMNRYTGCLTANDSLDKWSFYRYHVPDPVYFLNGIKVTLQQIGGNMKSVVQQMQEQNVPLIPVTVDDLVKSGKQIFLYEKDKVTDLKSKDLPESWTNFYRSDDVSATVLFYLNTASVNLPSLPPVAYRTAKL
ncbi:MAG TPA: glycoside hydrolase family 172 protein [Flavitalea sp.]|nr:glycoside hydrolase family 172 protein [Flavitalea sp.]